MMRDEKLTIDDVRFELNEQEITLGIECTTSPCRQKELTYHHASGVFTLVTRIADAEHKSTGTKKELPMLIEEYNNFKVHEG